MLCASININNFWKEKKMNKQVTKQIQAVVLSLLLVLSAKGYQVTNLTQLTNGPIYETGPVFNSDGTKIAYRYFTPPYSPTYWNKCDIWKMNIDGSSQTQITTASNGEFNPSFAPDGRITYTKEFGSNEYDIWIANSDGSNPHELVGGSLRQNECRWHPSGNKIVYGSEYISNASEIWTADADGTNRIKLIDHTTDGYNQVFPIYSRSGSMIAYSNQITQGSSYDIWVMNTDGSNKHSVVSGAGNQYLMFWWSDDSMLGYMQDDKIWLYNFGTHTSELLLSVPGQSVGWADLSPDGSKLAFDVGHIWTGDVVPEPATLLLLGLGGLALRRFDCARRRLCSGQALLRNRKK
jgi:Tol biopolymer transport system component